MSYDERVAPGAVAAAGTGGLFAGPFGILFIILIIIILLPLMGLGGIGGCGSFAHE
ncbi:hypothetical protein RBH29_15360 [Herbivorax sp. ANBcel31]|uniref:hypothetical protein n=1 Tax=Herbivorax sp. ANBcel31 TaxID=3069754 RepID=UPI0027B256B4|nr:hypothetical protein [Herbivorax sp. ANBcel31]MDQ2087808.1 hypothetical protein [Herbivorax sp. ANBcel31]